MSDHAERRLAAVVSADVVGYSRLMGEDEAATLAALRALRRDLVVPAVMRHKGSVAKSMGDGWLVVFPSVGDAVDCAIDVQAELAQRTGLQLRIGLHLGDVTHEDDDVFGDGINIAARLQELASPGGILISEMAHRSLDGRAAEQFADDGERPLKNIARPVRLYHWREGPAPTPAQGTGARGRGLTFAVLPFRIVSDGDDANILGEAILDGLTDSVSRLRWLRVIAAATMRQFPPGTRDLSAIATELRTDYLLDGDLRKIGERVRAAVRLIDGNGRQVSAERFEGRHADLFDLQDDMVARVMGSLEPNLMEAEYATLRERPARDFDLWSQIVEFRRAVYRYERESLERAAALAARILADDPDNSYVCGLAAHALVIRVANGWYGDPQAGWQEARQLVQRGLARDSASEECQFMSGVVEMFSGNREAAVKVMEDVVARDPNVVHMRIFLAFAYALQTRLEDALREVEVAQQLSPRDPLNYLAHHTRALAHCECGDPEAAIAPGMHAVALQPGFMPAHRVLVRALMLAGKSAEARRAMQNMLALWPHMTATKLRATGTVSDRSLRSLIDAGLPE